MTNGGIEGRFSCGSEAMLVSPVLDTGFPVGENDLNPFLAIIIVAPSNGDC